jgi:TRAP-type C4-dicarboxylate transport system permease small subunit
MQLLNSDRTWTSWINERFDTLEDWTAAAVAVFLILQALVMIANVLARQFGDDIAIANSTAQALIVWITFLVAAQQSRDDEHFKIDALHGRLPDIGRQLNDVFLKLIALVFAVTFLYSAILITGDTAGETSASGFPKLLLYLPAVLGGLLMTVEYFRQLAAKVVGFGG